MADTISWVATIATIVAASLTAANLGAKITGIGFVVFTAGAIGWIAVGAMTGQPALTWTNFVLMFLDVFGIWRWLGRQAKVEVGGRAASEASERLPGETLFPVSLLSRAAVRNGTKDLGHCIDAMAACPSGRISYVVVSQGGVAGVGETLRRLPWDRATIVDDALVTELDFAAFERLDKLPRDQWPAR
ncbi:MAG TPA: PRC-barrel domain containing protein [Sphingomicrobium sp.]|nr:PRC-barrel domain containing protein [Sphingomicrobium sp.]